MTLNSLDVYPDDEHSYDARIWYTDWMSGIDYRLEFKAQECISYFMSQLRDADGKLLTEQNLH